MADDDEGLSLDPVAADGELIEAAAAMPDSLPEQAAAATRIAARQRGKQGRRAARARAAIYDADALPTSGVNDDEEPFDDQDEEDYPAAAVDSVHILSEEQLAQQEDAELSSSTPMTAGALREVIGGGGCMPRVIDVFRKIDVDGSGQVELKEFTKGLLAVIPGADEDAIVDLFHEIDIDRSGSVAYEEMARALRTDRTGASNTRAALPVAAAPAAAHAAHSGVSAARALTQGASAAGGVSAAYPSVGAGDGGAPGGYCSEVDYEASLAKIKQYKKEAESRKKKEEELRRVQQEAYMRELALEEERAKEVREKREREARRARDEQRERFAKEREYRAIKRDELKQIEASEKARRVKYLFEIRDEQAREKAAQEEEARQAKLLANRQKYKPVEFLADHVELPQSAYADAPAGREAHRLVRHTKAVSVSELPPAVPRYRGPAREKAEQQLRALRASKDSSRAEAAERRKRALDFAKESAKEHVHATAKPMPKPKQPAFTTPKAPPHSARAPKSSGAAASGGAGGSGSKSARRPKASPRQLELGRMGPRAAKNALQVLGGPSAKDIEQRSVALTKQVRKKESQISGEVAKRVGGLGEDPTLWDVDGIVSARADLSNAYISAIKSQVELLEEISDARDQAAVAPEPALPAEVDAAAE